MWKIKDDKWEEFKKYMDDLIDKEKNFYEMENFYIFEDEKNSFGINKNDKSLSLVSCDNKNIEYYIEHFKLLPFLQKFEVDK